MICWFPVSDSAGSGGRDAFAWRSATHVSFVCRDKYTPEAEQRPSCLLQAAVAAGPGEVAL